MIQLIYGNEPYYIDYYVHKAKSVLNEISSFNFATYKEFNEDIYGYIQCLPLFSDKKVVILNIDNLNSLECELFRDYFKHPNPSCELIILPKKVDQRTKIYSLFCNEGCITLCNKLDKPKNGRPDTLKSIILREIKNKNSNITEEAYNELLLLLNYYENDDINLYNVINEVRNLIDYDNVITIDTVKALVKSNEKENVFSIAKLILANDIVGLKRQADLLSGQNSAIGTLCLLLREFRIAYKSLHFERNEIGIRFSATFQSLDNECLIECMEILNDVIDKIKLGRIKDENALMYAFELLIDVISKRSPVTCL